MTSKKLLDNMFVASRDLKKGRTSLESVRWLQHKGLFLKDMRYSHVLKCYYVRRLGLGYAMKDTSM